MILIKVWSLLLANHVDSTVVVAEPRQHPVKALEILDDTGLCVPYGSHLQIQARLL